jgi:hypothetical protein
LKSHSLTASYDGAIWWNSLDKSQRTVVFWLAHRNRWKWKQPECNFQEKANSLTTVQTDSELLYVWCRVNKDWAKDWKQLSRNCPQWERIYLIDWKSPTLSANWWWKAWPTWWLITNWFMWRKLTVRECARLQTLPDSFIFPVSDSRAYKAIGNGWTVKVIAHILSHIFK